MTEERELQHRLESRIKDRLVYHKEFPTFGDYRENVEKALVVLESDFLVITKAFERSTPDRTRLGVKWDRACRGVIEEVVLVFCYQCLRAIRFRHMNSAYVREAIDDFRESAIDYLYHKLIPMEERTNWPTFGEFVRQHMADSEAWDAFLGDWHNADSDKDRLNEDCTDPDCPELRKIAITEFQDRIETATGQRPTQEQIAVIMLGYGTKNELYKWLRCDKTQKKTIHKKMMELFKQNWRWDKGQWLVTDAQTGVKYVLAILLTLPPSFS